MRTLGAGGSHISSTKVSTCPVEFVDEEVSCVGTIGRFSIHRCWMLLRGETFGPATFGGLPRIPSQGAQVFVKGVVVNFVHPWLSVSFVSNIRDDVQ